MGQGARLVRVLLVVGTLLAALGLTMVALGAGQLVLQAAATAGDLPPAALWAVALTRQGAVWSLVAFGLLLLFFPEAASRGLAGGGFQPL